MQSETIRSEIEDLFRRDMLYCAESVLHVFNERFGRPLPPKAVKLASGFAGGMGDDEAGSCVCGALVGGVMVLGLAYGRSEPGAEAPDVAGKAKELHDWFVGRFGSACCANLIGDFEYGSAENLDFCVSMTGALAEHVAEMIEHDGCDSRSERIA